MKPFPLLFPLALCLVALAGSAVPRMGVDAPERDDREVDDREEEAAELLERAEGYARKGRYKDARVAYAKIAKKYDGTHAALVAARRSKPSAFVGWDYLMQGGPSANRVDVVIFGEAYELKHQKGYDKLAATIPQFFERQSQLGGVFTVAQQLLWRIGRRVVQIV